MAHRIMTHLSWLHQEQQPAPGADGNEDVDTVVFAAHDFLAELHSWYAIAVARLGKTDGKVATEDVDKDLALFKLWKGLQAQLEPLVNDESQTSLRSFNDAFRSLVIRQLEKRAVDLRVVLQSGLAW